MSIFSKENDVITHYIEINMYIERKGKHRKILERKENKRHIRIEEQI